MNRIIKCTVWWVWFGSLILGIAEAIRPGFLSLSQGEGWRAALLVLFVFAILGAIEGVVLSLFRRGQPSQPGGLPKKVWLLVVVLPLLGWTVQAISSMGDSSDSPRVVVLGLDGATWAVIDELAESASLENLIRLKDEAATGILKSESPPLSPRVWTTISTGVGPERHGAEDFLSTQAEIRVPRVWEIVEGHGRTVGVWEWLVTWPPGEHNGFLVPGWLNRGPQTWPPDLEFYQQLRGAGDAPPGALDLIQGAWKGYRNGLRLPTLIQAGVSEVRLKLMSPKERRTSPLRTFLHADMAADLFFHWYDKTEPDFAAFVLYSIDSLAHRFWIDFEPSAFGLDKPPNEGRYASVIPDGYTQADKILGRLVNRLDPKTLLMVISDHGTQANEAAFAHYSIRSEPLLKALDMEGKLGAFTVGRLLQLREIEPTAPGVTPEFVRMIQEATVEGAPLFEIDDSTPPFYAISVAGRPSLESTAVIGGREVPLARIARTSNVSGEHSLDGILAMRSATAQKGITVEGATIRDVTPTVLAYMGIPISAEMDGVVLNRAFQPESRAAREPKVVDEYTFEWSQIEDPTSDGEDKEVLDRLKALGYIQ